MIQRNLSFVIKRKSKKNLRRVGMAFLVFNFQKRMCISTNSRSF